MGNEREQSDMEVCELCRREVPATTVHHLTPKSRSKRANVRVEDIPVARLCRLCHKQVHALFTNRTLQKELYTLEALRREPEMERFLEWVKARPGTQSFRARKASSRR